MRLIQINECEYGKAARYPADRPGGTGRPIAATIEGDLRQVGPALDMVVG
jgi:hypothetical protein